MQWQKPALYAAVFLTIVGIMVTVAITRSTGKGHIEAEIRIARPAAEVFPWLIEPEKRMQWVDGLTQSSLDPAGPPHPGTSLSDVVESNGVTTEMRAIVRTYEPPRQLVTTTETPSFDQTSRCELSESAGTTTAHCVSDIKLHGWLARILAANIQRAAQDKLVADLTRLKTKIEAPPKP